MKPNRIAQVLGGLLCAGTALAQTTGVPPLPYQGGSGPEKLGLNSFGGNAVMLPSLQVEQLPSPFDDITVPFGPPRRYIVIRYYAIRPWFIHPYTGVQLQATDILRSVQSDNPDWMAMAEGKSLEELLRPDPTTGEALVEIVDGGLVDENNEAERESFAAETAAEVATAGALDPKLDLGSPATGILHAPFYGLYCIKIRICIPFLTTQPGQVWRYWVRWAYPFHQGWCWRSWWWYGWQLRGTQWGIWPYRPLCIPHVFWSRVGPDWIWHVTNPNRFRYWCLYGLRYHFTLFGSPIRINPVPFLSQLHLGLVPGNTTTGWVPIWPYPFVRYWPYGPWCTRWYWYRCLPWYSYRYLPPVVQAAFAIPKPEFGAGFLPPGDDQRQFPQGPPTIGDDGMFQKVGDSFFDVFFDVAGATTQRALVKPLGDGDGTGQTTTGDFPGPVREETFHSQPIDLSDTD